MYENKAVKSVKRDPVQVYKVYKDKRLENMLQPDSPFYLAVNYFKTEAQSKSEGSQWFKSQPMGVNKLNSLMEEMTETAGISVKTNHSARKPLVQKPQDNDVLPTQIFQITGHKILQSVNNYRSLRERQMENISRILSSSSPTANAVLPTQQSPQPNFNQAHPSKTHRLQPLKTHSVEYSKEIISLEVFSMLFWHRLKNTVTSPQLGPKPKKGLYIIESDSSGGSQE